MNGGSMIIKFRAYLGVFLLWLAVRALPPPSGVSIANHLNDWSP